MEKILLGNSDLEVSRLCFGGCPMGGYNWGEVSKIDLIKAVNEGIDNGINFFDSADTYGLGEGESTLSEALGAKRSKVVIATKFGVRVENGNTFYDNSPEWINYAVEKSLKRLRTDYIDLYQLHYRDSKTDINDVVETLDKLKQRGLIRNYGLSNVNQADIKELKYHTGKFVSFQNEFSLACRKNEKDIFTLSQEIKASPLTWGSLGQGVLTGKYNINSRFASNDRRSKEIYTNFHGEKFNRNLEIVNYLKEMSENLSKTIPAIAIRWILDYVPNSVVIAGIKNTDQLHSNISALGWHLNDNQINCLEQISILRDVMDYSEVAATNE
ncbi:aldo/keto reductase [Paenibacillus sp. FSL H8-0261]|uniref:aldo/keto reductase n=1 Tax=Paenibacillus sp. FSL H8-0261 TaxID=2921381 RepID=UPI00324801E3